MNSTELKAELEKIWQDRQCRAPCHFLKWTNGKYGYIIIPKELSWSKGRLSFPNSKPRKLKWHAPKGYAPIGASKRWLIGAVKGHFGSYSQLRMTVNK